MNQNMVSRLTKKKSVGLKPVVAPESNTSGSAGRLVAALEFGVSLKSGEYYMDALVDGIVWTFPIENYFIRLDPKDVDCLEILGTPRSTLSIIGNQQQNFHIMYHTKKSRLGFAPIRSVSGFGMGVFIPIRSVSGSRDVGETLTTFLHRSLYRFSNHSLLASLSFLQPFFAGLFVVSPTNFEEKGGMEVLGMKRKVSSLLLLRLFNPD
uniref:Xylanase inhibitor C-terminal domain-containing protein n=1 Tax=Nelumbo nucifera TaxID=4432 RepID=A0A822XUW4_NELNU|nr:TPA_asm: hypothetical protein HUJ06_025580 [Nelumbo nucifera]